MNIPRRDYLKEMMSVLFECALAMSMARSLASEPLFTKKMTWRKKVHVVMRHRLFNSFEIVKERIPASDY